MVGLVILGYSDFVAGAFIVGAVVLVALVLRRSIAAQLGPLNVTVGSIDKAVNHRPKDAPTLSEEVSVIAADIAAHRARFEEVLTDELHPRLAALEATNGQLASALLALTGRVDVIEHPLPPPPPPAGSKEVTS